MPKNEYVKKSMSEILALTGGQYTSKEIAVAFNMSLNRVQNGKLKIPKYVIDNPHEFDSLMESSKQRLKNQLG